MKNREDMKIGFGIIAFDDVCHLKNITAEIRDLCDYIVICLQKTSWHGDPIEQSVVDYVENLKNEKFIDDVIWFESKENHVGKEQEIPRLIETEKRNFIIDYLEKQGCTHAQITDSDEFYDHDDYEAAIKTILDNDNVHVTYCEYVNYYRDYRHVMVWPFKCYVPFIAEIKYRFDFRNGSFGKPSDPTRRYRLGEGESYSVFAYRIVKMHHFSWIRKDIREKIKNWSAKKYFSDVDGLVEKVIDRYNNYEDGQNAIILFNTPAHNVVVNKLPDQYVNPKFSIMETIEKD